MQEVRRSVQFGFLLLTLVGVFVFRANVELWCPMGGVEALYTYLQEGNLICSLGVSNFYILIGVLVTALLVRRAFCGYMCPIGTISEWLRAAARRLGAPSPAIPAGVDRGLALGKYVVLGVILWFTWRAGELMFRGYDPCYALISRHGADIRAGAYVVAGAIALASLLIAMPFCRWFCPFAAVLNPLSRFGLARIKRDAGACSGCRLCSRSCPMAIPVHEVREVTAARCISCMSCVEACQRNRSALAWGPPGSIGRRWPQVVLVAVLLACTAGAVSATYLMPMPSFVKTHGTPPAQTATLRLKIENLSCRGRANLLVWFLQRDDQVQPLGYFKLEAWPGPGAAAVRITYDPADADEETIRRAITEPYFQYAGEGLPARWLRSPFRIPGYEPQVPDGP